MSTTTLKDLIAQKEALELQIREAQQSQRAEAIAKVKTLMVDHGLSISDIASRAASAGASPSTGKKVAAKYKSADGEQTWSGRGLKPKWLREALESGKTLTDFAV